MMREAQSALPAADDDDAAYHIEAHASLSSAPPKVLKHDDAFAVLDANGDCGGHASPEGVYFKDTRYLSKWKLTFRGRRPLLLSSALLDDSSALSVALTNPDIEGLFARDLIAISRTKFLWERACYERIGVRNFDTKARTIDIELSFDTDFKDLFEVRGMDRLRRGTLAKQTNGAAIEFKYIGLDQVVRETSISFEPAPTSLSATRAKFRLSLPPRGKSTIFAKVSFFEHRDDATLTTPHFFAAFRQKKRDARAAARRVASAASSNDVFTDIMRRSASDIHMLLASTEQGLYPHAGIPWFGAVFGRDGIITALLMLWADPSIARGVLLHLAACQAREHDSNADAQPGKIIHERRHCEMARMREVPFGGYYGTVDATPLFVILAGLYCERTSDLETIRKIWPNILAALEWCKSHGDPDGDGFVEYSRKTPDGLANQGWKDSHDSIFHADGELAKGPIALVEVQAYVREARRQAAALALRLGDEKTSADLVRDAQVLKDRFNGAFWDNDLGTYALALDGDKRPCSVKTSNAGHVLISDFPDRDQVARMAATLMAADTFSGWGIRTASKAAPRYNPMSYHNGSVWPHDNAIIALGFARHGFRSITAAIFEGLYRAQSWQTDRRLPELFCGFARRKQQAPVSYPVSCSPQAWAAATPFGLLGACLGITFDMKQRTILFDNPVLPSFLPDVTLKNLRLLDAEVDVHLSRTPSGTEMQILRLKGDVTVALVPTGGAQ